MNSPIEDLVEILTKPKNAIIKQYQHLFAEENVKLEFTEDRSPSHGEKGQRDRHRRPRAPDDRRKHSCAI